MIVVQVPVRVVVVLVIDDLKLVMVIGGVNGNSAGGGPGHGDEEAMTAIEVME